MTVKILSIEKLYKIIFTFIIFLFGFVLNPQNTLAFESRTGDIIFEKHCSGCHINGGNVIRRSKNLKMAGLKRNGIDSPEAIAEIANKGIGSMDGYQDVLQEGENKIVAIWIWEQAQKAWVQG